MQEGVVPDPTPRRPLSSDEAKAPPMAKRRQMPQWQNSQRKEETKQKKHAYDPQPKKEESKYMTKY